MQSKLQGTSSAICFYLKDRYKVHVQNFTEAKGYKPLDIIGVKEVTEEENSVD